MIRASLAAAASVFAFAASAAAQDWNARPTFGETAFAAGSFADPHVAPLQAGGNLSARDVVGPFCRGYIANAPDYAFTYTAGDEPLFVSAGSRSDTTLVVRTPNGEWLCDDDGNEGLNPGLQIGKPNSGRYAVWVGTYSQLGRFPDANLFLSGERFYAEAPSEGSSGGNGDNVSWQGVLTPEAAPNYGSGSLTGGFTPDPFSVALRAGGDVSVFDLGGLCRGYVTASPDYVLNFTPGSLPLHISVGSSADTTLLVLTPSNQLLCDDDGGASGLNPGLTINNPEPGAYRIWAGTYGNSGARAAALHISEIGFSDSPRSGGVLIEPDAPANYRTLDLSAGFARPQTVDVFAGGDRFAGDLGGRCVGYVTSTPDVRVRYVANGRNPLVVGVQSARDTTLVVHTPSGQYLCDDDGGEGLNSELLIENPQSGEYAIWAGTYDAVAGTPEATVTVSEARGAVSTGRPNVNAAEGAFGTRAFTAGFTPDPFAVNVTAGGSVSAQQLPGLCIGFIDEEPTFVASYTAGASNLYISAASGADTTLVVRGPDGNYVCDDDSAGNFNPGVEIRNPQDGRYQIWVGTYQNIGTASARLSISNRGYNR